MRLDIFIDSNILISEYQYNNTNGFMSIKRTKNKIENSTIYEY